MSRCTLCGGKLTLNGKCSECGLDNTKNDKKYNLNRHNQKTDSLHQGDCSDNLNKDRGWQDAKNGSKSSSKAAGNAGAKAKVTTASKAGTKNTGKQTGSAADYQKYTEKKPDTRQSAKKQAERRAAGTVKKKKNRLVKWIVAFYLLCSILPSIFQYMREEVFYDAEEFIHYFTAEPAVEEEVSVENSWPVEEEISVDDSWTAEEEVSLEDGKAEEMIWNQEDEHFYTSTLNAGIYTGGYDIPAGTYQLHCEDETVYVYWWNPNAQEGGSAGLYSEEVLARYAETVEDMSAFSSYSETFELEKNGILFVSAQAGLTISGYSDGDGEIAERDSQNITSVFIFPEDDELVAGESFDAGTYDILAEGGTGASLYIDRNGSEYWIDLGAGETFLRFPFSEGTKVELELFGGTVVNLIPSF